MANELALSGELSYSDSENTETSLVVSAIAASVGTKKITRAKVSVGISSEEAVPLGECTSPGWAMFINRDSTNFITLKVATGGAVFAKLLPGEFCLLRLGSGAQAPYAIADTAASQLEYLLCQT